MAKYPKEEKERLIDDFKKEDIELFSRSVRGHWSVESITFHAFVLVQVFYFFTVLLNYGIIKVIDSYTYKGFEGRKPRRK